jgi:hypothetical protein
MFAQDGKIVVIKGIMKFKVLWATLLKHMNRKLVVHFRIGTQGTKTEDNTHPFLINDNLAVCHNGIFAGFKQVIETKDGNVTTITPTDLSDTAVFVETVLKKLNPKFLSNSGIRELLEHYCVSERSKLVFMDGQGRVRIFNESAGEWKDGMWFSNSFSISNVTVNKSGYFMNGVWRNFDNDFEMCPYCKLEYIYCKCDYDYDQFVPINQIGFAQERNIVTDNCCVCGCTSRIEFMKKIDGEWWCLDCEEYCKKIDEREQTAKEIQEQKDIAIIPKIENIGQQPDKSDVDKADNNFRNDAVIE